MWEKRKIQLSKDIRRVKGKQDLQGLIGYMYRQWQHLPKSSTLPLECQEAIPSVPSKYICLRISSNWNHTLPYYYTIIFKSWQDHRYLSKLCKTLLSLWVEKMENCLPITVWILWCMMQVSDSMTLWSGRWVLFMMSFQSVSPAVYFYWY